ncbi:MAG: 30S ribosomal protein S16 [Candidatus Dojkabacteria bacterium]|nr:30S ribosomal protein S16 [Candidatus Dojkabacteria bacterium]
MVKIRFARFGRKNLPHYKIVVINAREKRESKFLEIIGEYSPFTKKLSINKDRFDYWISVGAQPTQVVKNLVRKHFLNTQNTQ